MNAFLKGLLQHHEPWSHTPKLARLSPDLSGAVYNKMELSVGLCSQLKPMRIGGANRKQRKKRLNRKLPPHVRLLHVRKGRLSQRCVVYLQVHQVSQEESLQTRGIVQG